MSSQLVAILAAIAAAQARIEGMKAANTNRIACGNSIAYHEDSFLIEANHGAEPFGAMSRADAT